MTMIPILIQTPFNTAIPDIMAGLTSAQVEATGWNTLVRDAQAMTVIRTSDTVVTITLDPIVGYNITAQETVTATVPASALALTNNSIVALPTFTIDTNPLVHSSLAVDFGNYNINVPVPTSILYSGATADEGIAFQQQVVGFARSPSTDAVYRRSSDAASASQIQKADLKTEYVNFDTSVTLKGDANLSVLYPTGTLGNVAYMPLATSMEEGAIFHFMNISTAEAVDIDIVSSGKIDGGSGVMTLGPLGTPPSTGMLIAITDDVTGLREWYTFLKQA